MVPQQTLADYYSPALPPLEDQRGEGYFAAFSVADFSAATAQASAVFCRRDFYKIVLLTGDVTCHYADQQQTLAPGEYALLFANRQVPYRWEVHSGVCQGYGCAFTEEFLPAQPYRDLADWAIFEPEGQPLFRLTPAQAAEFTPLFEKMRAEQASAYSHKYELLFLYVLECLHGARKLTPALEPPEATAATRLAAAFRHLLAQQFPLVSPQQSLTLRTAQAFADALAVHVNYLSRTLKKATGKTTSQLLAERIVQEAKALLRHTDWSISQISYGLGFDEPTHFTQFFRRHTSLTPSQMRQV